MGLLCECFSTRQTSSKCNAPYRLTTTVLYSTALSTEDIITTRKASTSEVQTLHIVHNRQIRYARRGVLFSTWKNYHACLHHAEQNEEPTLAHSHGSTTRMDRNRSGRSCYRRHDGNIHSYRAAVRRGFVEYLSLSFVVSLLIVWYNSNLPSSSGLYGSGGGDSQARLGALKSLVAAGRNDWPRFRTGGAGSTKVVPRCVYGIRGTCFESAIIGQPVACYH
jgi:hypothetical protein